MISESRKAPRRKTPQSLIVTDELTGQTFEVQAKAVVNATGVWSAEVDSAIALRPSRGTHLVFSQKSFSGLRAVRRKQQCCGKRSGLQGMSGVHETS